MRGELREACGEGLSLCVALRRELTGFAQLLEDERTVAMGSTVRGWLLNVIGDVFSLYCVCKVGMASRSILHASEVRRSTTIDLATRLSLARWPPFGSLTAP